MRSILFAACLILSATVVVASDEPPIKIGIFNLQQLVSKAPQAEEARKRLESEFQISKERFDNKQKEYQAKRDNYTRNKDILSTSKRNKEEKELVKMEQELRRLEEEFRADSEIRNREEMGNFITTVKGAVD